MLKTVLLNKRIIHSSYSHTGSLLLHGASRILKEQCVADTQPLLSTASYGLEYQNFSTEPIQDKIVRMASILIAFTR